MLKTIYNQKRTHSFSLQRNHLLRPNISNKTTIHDKRNIVCLYGFFLFCVYGSRNFITVQDVFISFDFCVIYLSASEIRRFFDPLQANQHLPKTRLPALANTQKRSGETKRHWPSADKRQSHLQGKSIPPRKNQIQQDWEVRQMTQQHVSTDEQVALVSTDGLSCPPEASSSLRDTSVNTGDTSTDCTHIVAPNAAPASPPPLLPPDSSSNDSASAEHSATASSPKTQNANDLEKAPISSIASPPLATETVPQRTYGASEHQPPAAPSQFRTWEEIERSFWENQPRQPAQQFAHSEAPPVHEPQDSAPAPAPQQLSAQSVVPPPWDQLDRYLEECENTPQPTTPAITEKQLQALGKKHLLMMILDLQEALERKEEEHAKLLMAFQAGYTHGQRLE